VGPEYVSRFLKSKIKREAAGVQNWVGQKEAFDIGPDDFDAPS
jgi:hypothetical protein